MSNVKDLIAGARLPERAAAVCLRPDLVDEYERVELEMAAAPVSDSLAGGKRRIRDLQEKLDALRQEMAGHTLHLTLRALTRPGFRAMVDAHPPRKTKGGEVDERDKYIGINRDTFPAALVRACAASAELDDEDWRILLDERLTDAQFDALFETAWALNKRSVDVPFSLPGSPPIPTS
jgi:hypothetical protein